MLKGLIMKRLATAFAIATMFVFAAQAASAQTLKAVKDRGQLVCGANGTLAGFGMPDAQGNWTGSTSISAGRSPRPFSTIRPRSNSYR